MLDPNKLKTEEKSVAGRVEVTMTYDNKVVWHGTKSALPQALNDFIMKSLVSIIKEIEEVKQQLQTLNHTDVVEYEQLTVTPSLDKPLTKGRKTKQQSSETSD